MTKSPENDEEDRDSYFYPRPFFKDEEELPAGTLPPYSFPPADTFDSRAYVAELFKTPLFGAAQYDGAQNHLAPPVDPSRPRSWKLPGGNIASPTMHGEHAVPDDGRLTIPRDDTAAGARHGAPDSEKPPEPPPPIAVPSIRPAAEAPSAPSLSPSRSLDPCVEATCSTFD